MPLRQPADAHRRAATVRMMRRSRRRPASIGGVIRVITNGQYAEFLRSKHVRTEHSGFEVDDGDLNRGLFQWQRDIVRWALRTGKSAIFAECGLGKTAMQLEWAAEIVRQTGGPVLVLCPLAVSWQTNKEADKFNIRAKAAVNVVSEQSDVGPGISITNYERLHKFDLRKFVGVVPDESGILKSYTGVTKNLLVDSFQSTPYKLCCTATPAPNDRMELGNHCEFLSVMPSNEMLARWFINDTMKAGGYRLRRHGAKDFWQWVSSWAVAISRPSDLGYDDAGFDLPPLKLTEHIVGAPIPEGYMFHPGGSVSATNVHREKRAALAERADVVASLVNPSTEAWVIWCDTDYEADALCKRIPDAIEVRGSHPTKTKEDRLRGFSEGKFKTIVTKAEIGGYGLNWQHCHNMTWFAGYSFEKFYQAVRRLWRFGQLHTVNVHTVMSEVEESIRDAVKAKERQHGEMQAELVGCLKEGMLENVYGRKTLKSCGARARLTVPAWIQSSEEIVV